MAGLLDFPDPVWRPDILSDVALTEFVIWARVKQDQVLIPILMIISRILHACKPGNEFKTIRVGRGARPLVDYPCSTPGCERCENQRGGYAFKWAGPWCTEVEITKGILKKMHLKVGLRIPFPDGCSSHKRSIVPYDVEPNEWRCGFSSEHFAAAINAGNYGRASCRRGRGRLRR